MEITPDVEATPERPKVVHWQTILRRFPQVKSAEIAVIQAFHEFPYLTDAEIGKRVNLSRQTVNAIKNAEWFGDVLLQYALARNRLFTARTAGVDEFLLNRIAGKCKSASYFPDGDELRFLELANKRAGLIAPDAHLHFEAGGDLNVNVITDRLKAAVASVNVTPDQPTTCDSDHKKPSKQLR